MPACFPCWSVAARPDQAVAELARVVSRHGVVLAATNGYGHMREINDAIAEVFGDHEESLYEVFGVRPPWSPMDCRFLPVSSPPIASVISSRLPRRTRETAPPRGNLGC